MTARTRKLMVGRWSFPFGSRQGKRQLCFNVRGVRCARTAILKQFGKRDWKGEDSASFKMIWLNVVICVVFCFWSASCFWEGSMCNFKGSAWIGAMTRSSSNMEISKFIGFQLLAASPLNVHLKGEPCRAMKWKFHEISIGVSWRWVICWPHLLEFEDP